MAYDKNKIYFLNPSHILGGNETLFARVGLTYAKAFPEKQIVFVDYENGATFTLLKNEKLPLNVTLKSWSVGEKFKEEEGAVFVLASHQHRFHVEAKYLSSVLPSSAYVLFWVIDASGYMGGFRFGMPLLSRFGFLKSAHVIKYLSIVDFPVYKKLSKFWQMAIDKNSLIMMTPFTCKDKSKLFALDLEQIKTVPLLVLRKEKGEVLDKISTSPYKMAWIGRVSDAKGWGLLNLLQELNKHVISTGTKINFYIVGDGNELDFIKNKFSTEPLNIIYKGTMSPAELEPFLRENVELLWATGTSCLEGMKLGIPSVCVDVDFKKFSNNKLGYFLQKSEKGSIAEYAGCGRCENFTVAELMKYFNANYTNLSKTSIKLFEDNFSEKAVLSLFADSVEASSLKISDMEKIGMFRLSVFEEGVLKLYRIFTEFRVFKKNKLNHPIIIS